MNGKIKIMISRESLFGRLTVICMMLALAVRSIGCLTIREVVFADRYTAVCRFALPVAACALFVLCVLLLGEKAFWASSVPFAIGMLFFAVRVSTYDNIAETLLSPWHQMLCLLMYLLLTVLYSATVFGGIRTKWLLVPAFVLPLAYHIALEDIPAIRDGFASVSSILCEASILLMLLGMLFCALGLKKEKKLREIDPESGKKVAPPIPGDALQRGGKVKPAAKEAAPEPSEEQFEKEPIVLTLEPDILPEEPAEANNAGEPAEPETQADDKTAETPEPPAETDADPSTEENE